MTDTEAGAGAAPRTAAGRAMVDHLVRLALQILGPDHPALISGAEQVSREVAAIEAEARQQVVAEIKHALRPPPHLIGYSVIVAALNAALSEAPDEARAGAPSDDLLRQLGGTRWANEGDEARAGAAEAVPDPDDGKLARAGRHYPACWQSWSTAWYPAEWSCICANIDGGATEGPTPEAVAPDAPQPGRAQAETWLTTMEEGRIAAIHRAVAPDADQRPTSCLDGAWPCLEHDEHVLKAGRYSYGTTPEDYGPGDWEPNPYAVGEGRAEADPAEDVR